MPWLFAYVHAEGADFTPRMFYYPPAPPSRITSHQLRGRHSMPTSFYSRLSTARGGDSLRLEACVAEAVQKLKQLETTKHRPVILLGTIQGGKTRAFLGVIAAAFDDGYDLAFVFTKGTIALSSQTLARFNKDFAHDIADDSVAVFDIMSMPTQLVKAELTRKLIFISKKQTHNLERMLNLFEQYPALQHKRVLIVDDEADLASIRFVKKRSTPTVEQGAIATQLDTLRTRAAHLSFFQVTATPQSLYLQPANYGESEPAFLPKKPIETVVLPIHEDYVGGRDFFGTFEQTDPRYFLFMPVSEDELETLRALDGRSVRPDRIFTNTTVPILRQSLLAFLASVSLRRWQQGKAEQRVRKYAMVLHCDIRKKAHQFLHALATNILDAFKNDAASGGAHLQSLFADDVYGDLLASTKADGNTAPSQDEWFRLICSLLTEEDINAVEVNSDAKMGALLNADAELHLRTACNVFVGGNILDRGITIPNLISFYYGRNPKTMQADTVLQHSRIYGARDRRDLAATRFYTSRELFHKLAGIEALDAALRDSLASGAQSRGVVFIETDAARKIVPCSPTKLLISDTVTIKASGRLLPVGFTVRASTHLRAPVSEIDERLRIAGIQAGEPYLIDVAVAHEILRFIETTLDTEATGWSWDAYTAVIDYFSRLPTVQLTHREKIWIATFIDRNMARERVSGRLSNAPDTKQQRDLAEATADDLPMLLLFRQNGLKEDGWSGHPFWLPVLIAPRDAATCVYAKP